MDAMLLKPLFSDHRFFTRILLTYSNKDISRVINSKVLDGVKVMSHFFMELALCVSCCNRKLKNTNLETHYILGRLALIIK